MSYIVLPNEGFAGVPEAELPPDVRARDFAYLWDLMCYPDRDPALRQYAYATSNFLHTLERMHQRFGDGFPVTAELALRLARAPDATAYVGAGDDDTAFGGCLSGIILLSIIARSQHEETRDSARRTSAFHMVAQACVTARLRAGVDHLERRIWPMYRPVAHLWAAYHIWRDSRRDWEALDTRAGLREFLMIAEWFRRAGEAFKPLRTRMCLDPQTTWKVRPEVTATWPPLDLHFDDPYAWDLKRPD